MIYILLCSWTRSNFECSSKKFIYIYSKRFFFKKKKQPCPLPYPQKRDACASESAEGGGSLKKLKVFRRKTASEA